MLLLIVTGTAVPEFADVNVAALVKTTSELSPVTTPNKLPAVTTAAVEPL